MMNIEKFMFKNKTYDLHEVSQNNYGSIYSNILENIKICDTNVISNTYEGLSYDSLDYSNSVGFFISDVDAVPNNLIIYSSLIIDPECNQSDDKITKLYNEYSIDELLDININECVEVTLLCSNNLKRIPGLTRSFFKYIIDNKIHKINPDCKHVLLSVANIGENVNAKKFYEASNFKLLHPDSNLMIYSYTNSNGGKKNIKTKKTRTRKTKTRKIKNTRKKTKTRRIKKTKRTKK